MKTKEEKLEELKKKNEPPQLTIKEEVINSITHGIGAALAIAGFVLLLLKSDTGVKIFASLIYGISLIVMMLMSTLYHAFPKQTTVKRIWRRFDYISIYLLIAGTFAPILLVYLNSNISIIVFILQWVLVAHGIVILAIFGPGKWSALHFILYFGIGWSGLMFVPYFYVHNKPLLWMIFLGGIAYTVGMIPFTQNKKYSHCIWHIFVVLGALLHWIGIYCFIY